MKLLTLCLVHDNDRVLLGMKKRGFGAGRWNGFGGKVAPGETIEEAARRELLEEAGITAKDMRKRGVLRFRIDTEPEELEVHVFGATEFEGEPAESDEMRPQWFSRAEIPFDDMWTDDRHWFPAFFKGKNFEGDFHFEDTHTLVSYSLREE